MWWCAVVDVAVGLVTVVVVVIVVAIGGSGETDRCCGVNCHIGLVRRVVVVKVVGVVVSVFVSVVEGGDGDASCCEEAISSAQLWFMVVHEKEKEYLGA